MAWSEGQALSPSNLNNVSGIVFNVKDPKFGAVGDGVTDDTAAINAAFAAAQPEGNIVFFPQGQYRITSTININKHVTFRGVESGTLNGGTVIKVTTAVDPMFNITADDVGVQDLFFLGTATGTGILFDGSTAAGAISGVRVSNLVFSTMPSGIVFDKTFASIVENVRANPGVIKFRNGCTSITVLTCYAQNTTASAYKFEDVRYISLHSCAADGNSRYGYEIDSDCESIALIACGAEGNDFGFCKTEGETVGVYNCFGTQNGASLDGANDTVSGVLIGGKHTTVIGFNDSSPSDAGTRIANIHATVTAEDTTVIAGVLDKGMKDQGVRTLRVGVTDVDDAGGGDLVYTGGMAITGVSRSPTITTLADDATPTVAASNLFKTGGATTITDFDDGVVGQTIKILAAHSVKITDGAPIILAGGADYDMTDSDTLTLTMYDDQVWQEDSRSVN